MLFQVLSVSQRKLTRYRPSPFLLFLHLLLLLISTHLRSSLQFSTNFPLSQLFFSTNLPLSQLFFSTNLPLSQLFLSTNLSLSQLFFHLLLFLQYRCLLRLLPLHGLYPLKGQVAVPSILCSLRTRGQGSCLLTSGCYSSCILLWVPPQHRPL